MPSSQEMKGFTEAEPNPLQESEIINCTRDPAINKEITHVVQKIMDIIGEQSESITGLQDATPINPSDEIREIDESTDSLSDMEVCTAYNIACKLRALDIVKKELAHFLRGVQNAGLSTGELREFITQYLKDVDYKNLSKNEAILVEIGAIILLFQEEFQKLNLS